MYKKMFICFDSWFLGKTWKDKVDQLRWTLRKKKAFAFVLTALDEVACRCCSRMRRYEFDLGLRYIINTRR